MSTEKVRKTGGNNVPLVEQEADAICIAGNIVDRRTAATALAVRMTWRIL